MNKAICGSKESAAPHDELETWKETVLVPTLARYSPNNIYNGMKLPCFTSRCLTGPIVLRGTSQQVLQNVETDQHCLLSPTWTALITESCQS